MDGTSSGRARTPNYQREHGMLGALITFGRAGLDAARAAGWTPELARRPQIAALGAWLAEGIEAGDIVDMGTAADRYAISPPGGHCPPIGQAIALMAAAPNLGPVTVADIGANVALMIQARKVEKLAELQSHLDDAMRRGDLAEANRINRKMAAITREDAEKAEARKSSKPPPPETHPPTSTEKPRVIVNDRDPQQVIDDAWRVLSGGDDLDRIYQQEGRVVRVVTGSGGARIQPCGAGELRAMLMQAGIFITRRIGGQGVAVDSMVPPATWIGEAMAALPDRSLPTLTALAHAPYVTASGRIVRAAGYDAESKILLLSDWSDLPAMSVRAALALIDDWLCDFRMTAASDAANARALFLLPFLRPAIAGPTPGHLIEASAPGSGKSLLAKVLLMVGTGAAPKPAPFSDAEEERRKQLAALLGAGRAAILLDNLKGKVDSPTLEGMLTSDIWSDRLLGTMGEVSIPNRAAWVMTANNAELSLDLARRSLRIRLDPGVERPYERTEWRHPDIAGYTTERRRDLIAAAVALIGAWIEGGRPGPGAMLGSYEDWSRVVGGVLACAGVPGWLEDRADLYRNADQAGEEWARFVAAWAERHADAPVNGRQLVQVATNAEVLQGTIGDGGDRSQTTRLGKAISRQRGRIFGLWRIGERGYDMNGALYRLERIVG